MDFRPNLFLFVNTVCALAVMDAEQSELSSIILYGETPSHDAYSKFNRSKFESFYDVFCFVKFSFTDALFSPVQCCTSFYTSMNTSYTKERVFESDR